MRKFFLFIPIVFLAGAMLFSGGAAIAACPTGTPIGTICIDNPLQAQTFEDIIDSIINFIFYIALAIAPLMIVTAAFYYLTSAGDPKKITTAKDIILYTAVGFAIILLSKGFVAIIRQVLG